MRRILITGANSYIGTSFENYINSYFSEDYSVDTVDMIDGNWREKDFSVYDAVFHVAGIAHSDNGKITEEKKNLYYSVNTELSVETAIKAKNEGVKQFVYMSSAIVYGNGSPIGKINVINKDTPVSPANCYGDSKVQAENGLLPLQDESFNVVILRPPMIYGRKCKGNFTLLQKLARKMPVFPYVKNERSMLYVENLCEFVRLMIENNESGIFFPQNNDYVNTSELVKLIAEKSGKKLCLIKGFTPLLKVISKLTNLVNKAFGNLVYDKNLSVYKCNYNVKGFEESVEESIKTGCGEKKVLILTSVASMIDQFNKPFIKRLLDDGYSVDVACNFEMGNTCDDNKIELLKKELDTLGVVYHQIDFDRNPLAFRTNHIAYKQVVSIVKDGYSFIHCHSPIGGLIGRIVALKHKIPVIYTAHGFHFYKGANLKNWLIYYPIEKICSYFTDVLITINTEDYALAQKKMKSKRIEYVPGVGIETDNFGKCDFDKANKRSELGVPQDATLLLSVGELNPNKNQEVVIRAIAEMENIYYIIAGQGGLKDEVQALINDLNLSDRVKLLGFRNDITELCGIADIFVFPSFREGLSVSLMEAMASGLPVACSRIRGNVDLIDKNGGVLFNPNNVEECKSSIKALLKKDLVSLGNYNKNKIKDFSIDTVNEKLMGIYEQL